MAHACAVFRPAVVRDDGVGALRCCHGGGPPPQSLGRSRAADPSQRREESRTWSAPAGVVPVPGSAMMRWQELSSAWIMRRREIRDYGHLSRSRTQSLTSYSVAVVRMRHARYRNNPYRISLSLP
jgi:hypothetical protein